MNLIYYNELFVLPPHSLLDAFTFVKILNRRPRKDKDKFLQVGKIKKY